MKTLTELADSYGTDKGTLFHNYTFIYEAILEPIRHLPLKILEIGTDKGFSLHMWHDYFPNATVYGYDLRIKRKVRRLSYQSNRLFVYVGNQSNRKDLTNFIGTHGGNFDIVIDDGSHVSDHIQISLGSLFPHLKDGGMYFIEDLGANTAQDAKLLFEQFVGTNVLNSSVMSPSEVSYLNHNMQTCKFLDAARQLLLIIHK